MLSKLSYLTRCLPALPAMLVCCGMTSVAAPVQICPAASICDAVQVTRDVILAPESVALSAAIPEAQQPDLPFSPDSVTPLTVTQKFMLGSHLAFGPPAFLIPVLEAGGVMVLPPSNYPGRWHDGVPGFGRLYGDYLARETANYTAEFVTAAIFHEDPRYFPSNSRNPVRRFIHAVGFTLVDRSDSGRRMLALSNFAGSAAGGFVTMAYQPNGFNDLTHAGQRASLNLSFFLGFNLVSEFSPDLARLFHLRHSSNQPESASTFAHDSFPIWWGKSSR